MRDRTMGWWLAACAAGSLLFACGDDAESVPPAPATTTTTGAGTGGASSVSSSASSASNASSAGGGATVGSGGAGTGGTSVACDYEAVAGVVVIEAEDLPLSADWQVGSDVDASGGSYIEWTGNSQNNNPGMGLIAVDLHLPQAGRYRFQWRNRIGEGTNTTEHNDTWVRFADVDGFYGLRIANMLESRRYPRPACEDTTLMGTITAQAEVDSATCPNGTSSDGWLKVYSSGAVPWLWSTRTSDNDAHDIYIEIDAPGVHTLELSARGDHHLIDRIVLHHESVDDNTATDAALTATPCAP